MPKTETLRRRAYYQQALAKNPDYKAALNNLAALQTVKAEDRPFQPARGEPNNDILHANILPLNTPAGEVSSPSDSDFFRFTAVFCRATITASPSGINRPPSRRRLSFTTSKKIRHSTMAAIPPARISIMISFPFPARCTMFRCCRDTKESGVFAHRHPQHKYDQFEPNDDIASAKSIPLGKTIEANIMDPGDTISFR